MKKTMGDKVLVREFEVKGVTTAKTAGGFAYINNAVTLVSSVALADGPGGIQAGSTVWVSGAEAMGGPFKVVYTLSDGTRAVLIPADKIVMFESNGDA